MKTTTIRNILTAGLILTPMAIMAEDPPPALNIPEGTLKIDGTTISFGVTPKLIWSIKKPQVAEDVIEINNSASLEIKVDSIISIEAIGSGVTARNAQTKGTVFVNGTPTVFFQGSQNNIYDVNDWYYEPKPAYNSLNHLQKFTAALSGSVIKKRNSDSSTFYTSNLSNKGTYIDQGVTQIPVKAGDIVNITTEFWGGLFRKADSSTANQDQMLSFFDGDDIPTTKTSDPNQIDLVDMLDNGKIIKVGDNKYQANLKPNQLITLIDYNSTAVDINDFVYMVEVNGRDTLQDDLNYDYYIVKIDKTQRFVELDGDGNPIIPTDEDGYTYVDLDTEVFDEYHLIDGTESVDPNDPTKYTYQFNTPNGFYGSDYKLIAIYRGGVIAGGSTSTPGDIADGDTSFELATASLDTNGIIYEFELKNIVDPYPYHSRVMGDSSGDISVFNPEGITNYTFDAKRKVAGLIPRPLLPAELAAMPKGAYSVFFKHEKYTYVDGSSNESNVGTSIEGGVVEVGDQSIVFSGSLPTEDLWNTSKTFSNLKPLIAQGKNGEEHFIKYVYEPVWVQVLGPDGNPTGEKKLIGSVKSEREREILKTWAAPTATIQLTVLPDNGTAFRHAPYFECSINNIYPGGYVRIILSPVASDNPIKVGGKIESESLDVATLKKERIFRSANTKLRQILDDALGNTSSAKKVNDGMMRYDVIHYVDFDKDGVIDDTRVIKSLEWELDRSIVVKGSSLNTSE